MIGCLIGFLCWVAIVVVILYFFEKGLAQVEKPPPGLPWVLRAIAFLLLLVKGLACLATVGIDVRLP